MKRPIARGHGLRQVSEKAGAAAMTCSAAPDTFRPGTGKARERDLGLPRAEVPPDTFRPGAGKARGTMP